MSDSSKVSTGKPKVGGEMSVAPIGTTVPTNATTTLDESFVAMGHVSEDGVTNTISRDSEDIKAWGGEIVNTSQTEFTDEFSATLIETLNVETLKFVFGDSNVSGTLDTGITVKVNSDEMTRKVIVIDMLLNGGYYRRVVIPNGKISEVGEISYTDSDAIGYEVTIKAFPDTNGNTHYEYTAKPGE